MTMSRVLLLTVLGSLALTAGACGSMRLSELSASEVDEAYAAKNEASLFEFCNVDSNSLLGSNTRPKAADMACERWGRLVVAKLDAAAAKQDNAFLQQVCDEKVFVDSHPTSNARPKRSFNVSDWKAEWPAAIKPAMDKECANLTNCDTDAKNIACKHAKMSTNSANDSAMLAGVKACDYDATYDAFIKRFGDGYGSNPTQKEWFGKLGAGLAKCGGEVQETVMVKMLHWASGYGEAVADTMESVGLDFEKVLRTHLAKHKEAPFGFKAGEHAAAEAARWLRRNKRKDDCTHYIPYYTKMEDMAQRHWLIYFGDAGCVEAKPFAEKNLAHTQPGGRADACTVLGSIGDKKSLAKMKGLANGDPTWRWAGRVKEFWVQDACKAGMARIQAR